METIPQMDSIKKVILYEDGSKLNGMQLQTKQSTLIESFGTLTGTQKVIILKENEVLVGLKGREQPEYNLTYYPTLLHNVQFKILSIPKSTIWC